MTKVNYVLILSILITLLGGFLLDTYGNTAVAIILIILGALISLFSGILSLLEYTEDWYQD